ncbi:MAG: hypothetical protein SF172_08700 [Burkholderiales bacterium]|nr:hypothetical protein [Burkholderiales bacterium]
MVESSVPDSQPPARSKGLVKIIGGDPAKRTAGLSLVLLLLSLALPAFLLEFSAESWPGISVLFVGTLVGWMANGFAVYANYLLLLTLLMVWRGRGAWIAAMFMLALTGTVVFFDRVPSGQGGSQMLLSWGWGAVVWLAAIWCAWIAALLALGEKARFYALLNATFGVAALMFLVYTRADTFRDANVQERESTHSPWMAWSYVPVCSIPLTWPVVPVAQRDEVLTLDIERDLTTVDHWHARVKLPPFQEYERDGFRWTAKTRSGQTPVVVGKAPAQGTRLTLSVKQAGRGAQIALLENATGKKLYSQPLSFARVFPWRDQPCPQFQVDPALEVPGVRAALETVLQRQER